MLGSWCFNEKSRPIAAQCRYEILPFVWDDPRRLQEALADVDAIYERMLASLGGYLDKVHRLDKNLRYWRIVIGDWLITFVHVVYDRYNAIQEARARDPHFVTTVLDPADFQIPHRATTLIDLVADDFYNLEIFSQLLYEMGYRFPSRRASTIPGNSVKASGKRNASMKETIARLVWSCLDNFRSVFMKTSATIVMTDMHCSTKALLAIWWKSRLRCWPTTMADRQTQECRRTAKADPRRLGLDELPAVTGFEKILVRLLKHHFPCLYLEEFDSIRQETRRQNRKAPAAYVSATGWFINETFKLTAAEAASEAQTKLCTVQHGGVYGTAREMPFEGHEWKMADRFFAWGWADAADKVARNLPSLKLSVDALQLRRASDFKPRAPSRSIVYISTGNPRYLNRFHSQPMAGQMDCYGNWQHRFFKRIPSEQIRRIRYRQYPGQGENYGLACLQKFPDLASDQAPSSRESLRLSQLAIVDHCGTSFLECYVANVPTLIFWDPRLWRTRDSAAAHFSALRSAGMLWDSPEQAADQFLKIQGDPWHWWLQPEIQNCRQRMIARYALSSTQYASEWASTLRSELARS